MKKPVLPALLLIPSVALACADQWSPDNWVLNPQEDTPILALAMSTDGSRFIDLSIQKQDSPVASFTLERPQHMHSWLFNTCQLNRRHDPSIFAVAHSPEGEHGPRWTSKLTVAYRINLKARTLEKIGLENVRCFISN